MSWKNHFSIDRKRSFFKHFYASCSAVELVEQSHGHMAVWLKGTWGTFHTHFFFLSHDCFSWAFFGHSSHQNRHQGLGWDHLSGQVQSCHTAVLLSAPQGLAPRALCIFGAHLCLAGFTGVKIPALINPHWYTLLSCWLEFVPKAMCKCCVGRYKTQSDQGR